jgi:small subunit ribosomal protein S14
MKYLQQKDLKNKIKFFNKETDKKINKFLFINLLNTDKLENKRKKIITKFFLSKKQLNSNKTKLLRRCLITNRSRVSSRLFGISRIKLRELLTNNQIPGFNKNIW